jgi:hypothetical protein
MASTVERELQTRQAVDSDFKEPQGPGIFISGIPGTRFTCSAACVLMSYYDGELATLQIHVPELEETMELYENHKGNVYWECRREKNPFVGKNVDAFHDGTFAAIRAMIQKTPDSVFAQLWLGKDHNGPAKLIFIDSDDTFTDIPFKKEIPWKCPEEEAPAAKRRKMEPEEEED